MVDQTINLISERSEGESIVSGHEPRLCGIAIDWRPIKAQHGRGGALRHLGAHFLTRRE
ncbi:hypothetical protein P3T23_005627 [Paraburkholderia sp. GAS448]|uniref:hypothetical protein n=1 Tax=Paraburkholderia sp. GAS448 TaxID=3035136 RepID=UPI003D1C5691